MHPPPTKRNPPDEQQTGLLFTLPFVLFIFYTSHGNIFLSLLQNKKKRVYKGGSKAYKKLNWAKTGMQWVQTVGAGAGHPQVLWERREDEGGGGRAVVTDGAHTCCGFHNADNSNHQYSNTNRALWGPGELTALSTGLTQSPAALWPNSITDSIISAGFSAAQGKVQLTV